LLIDSNQFGGQEPGSDEQIEQFACQRYRVSFPLFAKIEVNGDNTHPLYQWLKSQKSQLYVLFDHQAIVVVVVVAILTLRFAFWGLGFRMMSRVCCRYHHF
jgi:glutathione peroxidase-family protein